MELGLPEPAQQHTHGIHSTVTSRGGDRDEDRNGMGTGRTTTMPWASTVVSQQHLPRRHLLQRCSLLSIEQATDRSCENNNKRWPWRAHKLVKSQGIKCVTSQEQSEKDSDQNKAAVIKETHRLIPSASPNSALSGLGAL